MRGSTDAPTNDRAGPPEAAGGGDADDAFHRAFRNVADADGAGAITSAALWSHVSREGGQCTLSRGEVDALFRSVDRDNDGAIDFAEYSGLMDEVKARNGGRKRKNKGESILKVRTQEESLFREKSAGKIFVDPRTGKAKRPSKVPTRQFATMFRMLSILSIGATSPESEEEDEGDDAREPWRVSEPAVRFFDVEVREYPVTASDNPCVPSGAALELGWDYDVKERSHLDTFEERRSEERVKDLRKEKKLTRIEREKILRNLGASPKEIQKAAKRATIVRNGRRKSIAMKKHDREHERTENLLRKLKSALVLGGKKDSRQKGFDAAIVKQAETFLFLMGLDDQ